MAKTFFGLLPLADLSAKSSSGAMLAAQLSGKAEQEDSSASRDTSVNFPAISGTGLHYNIQIHLPPTKDIEVYNAIFKSLKEHLFDQ